VQATIRWIVPSRKQDIGVINAGLDVWLASEGISSLDSRRIQVCVEGVFSYCVGTIRSAGRREDITVSLYRAEGGLRVVLQHCGPEGEWDACLKAHACVEIKRTSFDAMGLFIARQMLDSLVCESMYDVAAGVPVKTFDLRYSLDKAAARP
jgi:hypothetical protein